jgi:hypothetical protein
LFYNRVVPFIYLSPHLDDVTLSCGGLVWEQVQAGEQVEIWTICAGDPPPGALSPYAEELHHRWGYGIEAIAERRIEDIHNLNKGPGSLARQRGCPYFSDQHLLARC